MTPSSSVRIIATVIYMGLLFSCNPAVHNKKEVESAMKQYDRLIQKMDADSIALLYAPDGNLGSIAHGRDSIRKFLSGFKGFHVLLQSSSSDSIDINGDTSYQKGRYQQIVVTPGKDTLHLKGEYTATWLWIPGNGWRIRRMETKPIK